MRSPVVIRSIVETRSDYRAYREDLRHDFWFSCAYCSMAEVESQAIPFSVDHYEPQSVRPDLIADYGNLMWVCQPCNSRKKDITPHSGLRAAGFRYVRPDQDHPDDHYELDGLEVSGTTNAGKYTAARLDLNRPPLKELRALRQRMGRADAAIKNGVHGLRGVSVDRFPPELRARVLQVRQQVLEQAADVEAAVEGAIRDSCRSRMIDPVVPDASATKVRRDYLKSIHALHPDPEAGPAAAGDTRVRQARRQRKKPKKRR